MTNHSTNSDPKVNVEIVGDERRIGVGSWTLVAPLAEDEPRVRDIDLGARLGYPNPKDIRKLARDHEKAGNVNPFHVRTALARTGAAARTEDVMWFGEADALWLASQSKTPAAVALTKEMIRVFMLARRGLLPQQNDATAALLARLTATIEMLHARVESLESRPVANLDRPALGAGAARLHVLNPLREIAQIEARAAKREGDKRAIASLRLLAENDLRARIGFLRSGGQSWDRFPQARLGDLHCALVGLFHAARRRANILQPTSTQLRLLKQA